MLSGIFRKLRIRGAALALVLGSGYVTAPHTIFASEGVQRNGGIPWDKLVGVLSQDTGTAVLTVLMMFISNFSLSKNRKPATFILINLASIAVVMGIRLVGPLLREKEASVKAWASKAPYDVGRLFAHTKSSIDAVIREMESILDAAAVKPAVVNSVNMITMAAGDKKSDASGSQAKTAFYLKNLRYLAEQLHSLVKTLADIAYSWSDSDTRKLLSGIVEHGRELPEAAVTLQKQREGSRNGPFDATTKLLAIEHITRAIEELGWYYEVSGEVRAAGIVGMILASDDHNAIMEENFREEIKAMLSSAKMWLSQAASTVNSSDAHDRIKHGFY